VTEEPARISMNPAVLLLFAVCTETFPLWPSKAAPPLVSAIDPPTEPIAVAFPPWIATDEPLPLADKPGAIEIAPACPDLALPVAIDTPPD
jgi:hypothetical protein